MTDDLSAMDAMTSAGWFPRRSVPIGAAEAALAGGGYEAWEGLLAFLREFSGLTIRFMRNGREDSVWFDAERAVAWTDVPWVREYERRFGTRLAPIGSA
ncbi:MAG TPA: SUKH-3 domain-containing protein [Candidatus Angelobacter sp.]|jgi:hypothetical protein|nr:SUKH-3 domain-containing protein [Candidatus Angelobacter sp.]